MNRIIQSNIHCTCDINKRDYRGNKMAAGPFLKRRAGLSAILKNHLVKLAPQLHNEGFISKTESEAAMDASSNKRERAEALVEAIGRKIKADEPLLREFLRVLRETGIAHIYVKIMEREAKNTQGNGNSCTSSAVNSDQGPPVVVNHHSKDHHRENEDEVDREVQPHVPSPQQGRYDFFFFSFYFLCQGFP